MPVPILILGVAGIAALAGLVTGGNALAKNIRAMEINSSARAKYYRARNSATLSRDRSNKSPEQWARQSCVYSTNHSFVFSIRLAEFTTWS